MVLGTNLGFPRIGPMRELKKAVEAYWKGQSSKDELLATAKDLRAKTGHGKKRRGLTISHQMILPFTTKFWI